MHYFVYHLSPTYCLTRCPEGLDASIAKFIACCFHSAACFPELCTEFAAGRSARSSRASDSQLAHRIAVAARRDCENEEQEGIETQRAIDQRAADPGSRRLVRECIRR